MVSRHFEGRSWWATIPDRQLPNQGAITALIERQRICTSKGVTKMSVARFSREFELEWNESDYERTQVLAEPIRTWPLRLAPLKLKMKSYDMIEERNRGEKSADLYYPKWVSLLPIHYREDIFWSRIDCKFDGRNHILLGWGAGSSVPLDDEMTLPILSWKLKDSPEVFRFYQALLGANPESWVSFVANETRDAMARFEIEPFYTTLASLPGADFAVNKLP